MEQSTIEAVKAHAIEHYTEGGWDVIIECFSDEEIADQIKDAQTVEDAIKKMAELASLYAERQADAKNSAF